MMLARFVLAAALSGAVPALAQSSKPIDLRPTSPPPPRNPLEQALQTPPPPAAKPTPLQVLEKGGIPHSGNSSSQGDAKIGGGWSGGLGSGSQSAPMGGHLKKEF